MKLHLDARAGQNAVTGYGDGWIEINGARHAGSLLLLPESIVSDWGTGGFDTLSAADFARIAALEVEVVLLGTGAQQRFPRPELLAPLLTRRVGIEVMDLQAACRTFNILMGEGRRVAAALLID